MWRVVIVIAALSAMPWPAWVAARCLEYDLVSLGTVVPQTYPGPPDYESVTKGDEPQVIWVLILDRRLCTVDADYYQREIQLRLAADQYAQYRHLLGKRVMVTGRLLHGSGRYGKHLVLAASEIQRMRVRP